MLKKLNTTKLLVSMIILAIIVIGAITVFYPEQETKTVKIGYLPISASLPLYIGVEKGYFEGIDVELVKLQSTNQLVDGLISNNVDTVIAVASQPLLSAESLQPGSFKVFTLSALKEDSGFEGLLVKKDSDIKKLSDLENKKIGVFPGSTAKTFLKLFLDKEGVKTENIEYIPLTPPNQIGALSSGSIDALFAYEPTKTIALSKGIAVILDEPVFSRIQNPFYIGVSAFSKRFVENDPDAAEKVKDGLYRSIDFMRQNERESKLILTKYTSLTEDLALKSPYMSVMLKLNEIDKTQFQELIDLLLEQELIHQKIKVDTILY